MAVPESQLRTELRRSLVGHSSWDVAEHIAVVVLLMWWAVPFTRAIGGRGVHNELLYLILVGAGLVAVRAWRAPMGTLLGSALTALCALLVCVLAPTHWYGSDVAAGYALAAGMFVVGRRYVRDADRRYLVAASICLAGVYQFSLGFQPWWGGRDSSVEMTGTFYWHNPYAAFLLPGAIVGLGLIMSRRSPWTIVGWVSVPLCAAGVVFSSSRATLAAMLVGWVLVLAGSVRARTAVVRVLGGLLLAGGLVAVMPGPPLFPGYHAPWSAASQRVATGQTLTQNGEYRTEFWRAAVQDAIHHPAVGTGYHALASAAPFYTPSGWARSPLAHNGYLQAFSDGGLLLGLPILLCSLLALGWALRRLWSYARVPGAGDTDAVSLAAAVALLALMAHVAVDFDWSHPSIRIETVLLAVCVAPMAKEAGKRALTWGFVPLLVLLGGFGVLVPALHQWQVDQPRTSQSTSTLLGHASATFGDYRPAETFLQTWQQGLRKASRAQVRQALDLTASAAKVDLDLSLLRFAVGAQSGLIPDAVAQAEAQLARVEGGHGPWAPDMFYVYLGAGDRAKAEQVLRDDIASQVAAGVAAPNLVPELNIWTRYLDNARGYACELRSTEQILGPAARAAVPSPDGSCPRDHQANG